MKRFAKRLRPFGVLDTPSALAAAKRYMPEGLNKSSPKTHQAMMLRISFVKSLFGFQCERVKTFQWTVFAKRSRESLFTSATSKEREAE